MRKWALICLLMILGIATAQVESDKRFTPIVDAFSKTGLEFKEANINGWVVLENTYESETDLVLLTGSICECMGIEFISSGVISDGFNKKITAVGGYEEGTISISVERIFNTEFKDYQSVAIVDVTHWGSLLNINNIGEKVLQCLKKCGSNPRINICLTGCADGRLEEYEMNRLMNLMLADVGAEKLDAISTDNLISVCGYTRNIRDYIKAGGKKININTAVRYSPSADKTCFWIGTPVINVEY